MPLPYPVPSSKAASAVMRANRRADTGPEVRLRRELHGLGLRFRKGMLLRLPEGTTRPDVVFTRQRVAVFLDGCFWHGCPEHGTSPRTNSGYWGPKLRRNVERDREADRRLMESGWTVVRVWEHEEPSSAAARVARALG